MLHVALELIPQILPYDAQASTDILKQIPGPTAPRRWPHFDCEATEKSIKPVTMAELGTGEAGRDN